MLTIQDVRFKIQDICNEYVSGNPPIHLHSLAAELKTTEQEIIPHLDQLHAQGVITFHDPVTDTFSLIGKNMEEN